MVSEREEEENIANLSCMSLSLLLFFSSLLSLRLQWALLGCRPSGSLLLFFLFSFWRHHPVILFFWIKSIFPYGHFHGKVGRERKKKKKEEKRRRREEEKKACAPGDAAMEVEVGVELDSEIKKNAETLVSDVTHTIHTHNNNNLQHE